ncbi:MAG: UDP-N-acetylglucosamine--N-acetylmuramyl-(pentapeptide) pyrophosphoryl-undecaprenol N-acetylglucosamine transferase, partial [Patescibacteria group bacterium]
IMPSKFRRYFSLLNFMDFFKFCFGICQGLWKIFWIMPDLAFSKGGPGSLAVILVCKFYKIPIVIHESDAVPGLTNRISAKYAQKIELAFNEAKEYFEKINAKAEIKTVGQPVREELLLEGDSAAAKKSFGFHPEKPVVLIVGGSQGAEKINDFVLENLESITSKFQILHSIGANNYGQYKLEFDFASKDISPELLKNYRFAPYFYTAGEAITEEKRSLKEAYDAADVIVSRAGASAIFEIAARGKPSILIPLPTSANGHQEQNAYIYGQTGAAIILEEENFLENIFINALSKILSDKEAITKMSSAARNFYKPAAAQKISDDIVSLITNIKT